MTEVTKVRLNPAVPNMPGQFIELDLLGQAEVSGGFGGWGTIERPRREAATEWVGTPELLQTLPVAIDGRGNHPGADHNVESTCALLEGWGLPHRKTGEPPILSIAGPVYGTNRRWVIDDLVIGDAVRGGAGRRISQDYTLVLRAYVAPKVLGPAAAARRRKGK